MNRDEIRSTLKKHGLRATNARLGVANFLLSAARPLSHSELVQELSEQYGDQATIYRTLITFVDKGLIRVASNVGGISRYEFINNDQEASTQVHPHFVCKACGIVACLPKTIITHAFDEQWKDVLHNSEVQFLGTCLSCA